MSAVSSAGKWAVVGGCLLALSLLARPAHADDHVVAPGDTLEMQDDLVLAGADNLTVGGPGARAAIHGNGHSIIALSSDTDHWTGHVTIQNTDVTGIGTATVYGMDINGVMTSDITIEDTVFSKSGALHLTVADDSTSSIRRNTVLADSLVPAVEALADSRPAIEIDGPTGMGQKFFQGNHIYKSWVTFHEVINWLIGGDTPADSNIVIGTRAGIVVDLCTNMVVRGNYIHLIPPFVGWNQVSSFTSTGVGNLVEHNIIRGGNWLVHATSGTEFRYNIFGDSYERPWLLLTTTDEWLVHHNLFIRNDRDPNPTPVDGIGIGGPGNPNDPTMVQLATDQIYNNTLDGGGECRALTSGAVSVGPGGILPSLRNNVITRFRANIGPATAMVHGGRDSMNYFEVAQTPPVARLAYADYNLFNNPDAFIVDNYSVGVAGKTERVDPGFAANDVMVGGPVNQQVDPQFTGPIPYDFPYGDDDIEMGKATVCQMLAFYRQIYTPAPGSPLIDSGDPADGPGTDIGAIGAGMARDDDLFGKLCPDGDIGMPSLPQSTYECTPIGGSHGIANTQTVPDSPGFICVCEAGPAPGRLSLHVLAAIGICAGTLRRRRSRRK
ncbi:MAG TPA: hypothetical protein VH374_08345 [Polyangia bacterium]|nr:hypothetical protein [Polyangia bacterium]